MRSIRCSISELNFIIYTAHMMSWSSVQNNMDRIMNVILLRSLFLIINLHKGFLFLDCFFASDCLQLFVLNHWNVKSFTFSLQKLSCVKVILDVKWSKKMLRDELYLILNKEEIFVIHALRVIYDILKCCCNVPVAPTFAIFFWNVLRSSIAVTYAVIFWSTENYITLCTRV